MKNRKKSKRNKRKNELKAAAIFCLTFSVMLLIFVPLGLGWLPNRPRTIETAEAAPETQQNAQTAGNSESAEQSATIIRTEPKHAIININHELFNHSLANPRRGEINGFIRAGIVPHHTTAATLISGFFSQAADFADYYDLVIILAPNHSADLADVVLSYRDWDIGEGVFTNRDFINDLSNAQNINTAISHEHLELDHSASVLIPYIHHYLPNTKVAPILLNRSLSFEGTINLFDWIADWIDESEKNILLVASIDFSHFLTSAESAERDSVTANAILNKDYFLIHTMDDSYLDSPASLIIFLKYLEHIGVEPQTVVNTDASEFLGFALDETTSYKVIVGAWVERPIRLTFVGDIMLHEGQTRTDFDYTFSRVRPHLESADLAIGNLETVLNGYFRDYPLFSAPDEFGYAIRNAGFDLLSTSNNHSLDRGVDGLLRTLDFLDTLGIESFGTYRSQEERDTVLIREVGGIRFAFLSYSYGLNGLIRPQGRDYLVNLLDMDLIRRDISHARELADFVIVMPHMGNEYETYTRQVFQDYAMGMIQAGADIVVAGHPHVVQPMGFVHVNTDENNPENSRRGFIAYCLGNFVSSQRTIPREAGVMLNLYFTNNPPTLTAASYVPTWVQFTNTDGQRDVIILPISETLEAFDNGHDTDFRQVDINRMRDAHREIAETIFGHSVALQGEYFLD
ncbi:MAG: AmmeMemoRadiSam system protein B [Defluviitaleaceae bacterium]|nr:AmmeMemoRadiSam system protein B [Defluviitaleaceae bacterium]